MPKKVREKADSYSELEEEQGSFLNMLITFAILIAITALICTIVWKVTHKTPRTELGNVQVPVSPSLSETLVSEDEVGQHGATDDLEMDKDPINGDANMAFEAVDEDVTAKDVAIIRILPSTDGIYTVAGQLRNGQFLKRTGVNKETGWSKVIFNGQEGYAITSYLTADKDYKTKAPANPDNRVTTADGYIILFRDCEEYVTVASTVQGGVNLRTEPSTTQGKATVSAQLNPGLTAKRTGISIDSGWSRVEFNGLVLYAVTNFVQEVSTSQANDVPASSGEESSGEGETEE